MTHIHLFEFTDLSWYPGIFRRIQTDYLQFVSSLGSGHKYLVPLFEKALRHANTNQIVDLCSGGSGPWIHLREQLAQAGLPVDITLTDKYPHLDVLQKMPLGTQNHITYCPDPVDALNIPEALVGMRTLFEGFHHFPPQQARFILMDATQKHQAIGIFEASLKSPYGAILLVLSPLTTLAGYLLMTPFIKPLTFSRILWTYLIPLVPLATCWDGIVSLLRTYSPGELREMADSVPSEGYIWETGLAPTGTPVFTFTYLVGFPSPDKS